MGLNLIYRIYSLVVRKLKIIFTIIVIFLVVLWFGGNLGLYLYLKHKIITPERVEAINQLPQTLILKESNLDSDSICFSDIKLKFPFYKDDISRITPLIYSKPDINYQSISIGTAVKKDDPTGVIHLSYHNTPEVDLKEEDKSIPQWFWSLLPGDYKEKSLTEATRIALNTTFSDYSFWNLNNNLKMVIPLILKLLMYSPNNSIHFDIKTPHIDGILQEVKRTLKGKKRAFYSFNFYDKEDNYSIIYSDSDDEDDGAMDLVKNIIASIEFIDKEECYEEMEAEYRNKAESKYPEELLLLSMISIKGPTVENLTELKQLLEEKSYKKDDIDRIDEQIKILKENGSNTDK